MTVTTWPLANVLGLAPAWGGDTWSEVIESVLANPGDMHIISQLAGYLTRDGSFREPVRVDIEQGHPYIGNGMHRILAHILTGHDQVQVTHDQPPVRHAWQATMLLTDQPTDLMFDVVDYLSLPIDDDTWLEKCGASTFGLEGAIDLVATNDIPAAELAQIVADYLTEHGIPMQAGQVTITRQWLNDDPS